ncbi:hypothetical protein M8J71_01030 [Pseudarthrobacter sp. R1]|uniref:hypothetical protein n=1 Tax=Pseudarthrobacter sp. R1 TaxID=2944934 RepID=UPI00210B8AC7|nr:hypothetical protein [Pseudarthrobacter sp. R1]MCQ6269091.1 hypothetical protein [Pseudarthrobacter sp. R1]
MHSPDGGLSWRGAPLRPEQPLRRRDGYLIFTDSSGTRHWYGSDAVTNSYNRWLQPEPRVAAIAGPKEKQRARYPDIMVRD